MILMGARPLEHSALRLVWLAVSALLPDELPPQALGTERPQAWQVGLLHE